MEKTLRNISWNVDEATYRADTALSYSTIAKFAREGFNKLDSLFDKVETPSLTFGSAVDAIITGGQEEFNKTFFVADFPNIPDSIIKIVKEAFNRFNIIYHRLEDIPNDNLIKLSEEFEYQLNWKPETRAKVIKEKGSEYYNLLYVAGNRKVINVQTKSEVDAAVDALKNSPATKYYFTENNPFEPNIYREYQLKFKACIDGVDFRCMADLLLVDAENKIIYPIDLKTSSHTEWDFYESFIEWRYHIQARLYWRIIRACLDTDDEFKEYKLADYKFIVVNRKTLTPLVWEYEDTQKTGTLYYGKDKQIECKDPVDLGRQLHRYLGTHPAVPDGIETSVENNIVEWLNKI